MHGLMQDSPLTIHHILWRMERLFARKAVSTKRANGMHRYTYGDLVSRTKRLAAALSRLGVKEGDRVATLAWNNYRHLELYYAIPCMGAVLHTLNLRLSPDQLAFIANDAGDSVIVVDDTLLPLLEKFIDRVPGVRHVIVMSDGGGQAILPVGNSGDRQDCLSSTLDYETLLAAEEPSFEWPQLDERAAAAMCYTSGTTGHPKGVIYSHRSTFLHTLASLAMTTMGVDEADTILAMVPMFHANAWGLPYTAGMSGASFVFPDRWMGDADAVLGLAESERATILAGVPTIWIGVLQKLGERGLPHVRHIICGGSAVPRSLIEAYEARGLSLLHAWGMTELSPMGSIAKPRSWHEGNGMDARVTQGPPAPCVELRITDLATGAELPWDGTTFGELEARGPWVASGYHNGADADRFQPGGWFRTGDVAAMTPDGYINIVDRAKDVIKSGGEWVSSVELENAIMAHPKVLEAAVIGVPHPKWSERPVGYVVPRAEFRDDISPQEILAHLESKFMRWWLPDEIRFIDEVPKTSVGKFDKKVLRARAEPLRE
ncbi:MAG TPA: long-chain fatty acid--CoA ligase [Thermoanaerobaculia bacterium]|nr:long-chain fatty acid--CoA ligase [Thermoanaerobaculia bacterium]